ncbi:hypothetical protein SAMN06264346_101171 [Chryseobacterium profundimaris]|uniref:Uncharacterized protein n=1 Tax=Chryseobacterium profundimaris TaxID=1387275 RepID=A0ABY1N8I3_9FLAO|nr:hypothetical protein SAMN06264346_101171 [Chryseobacterium profundimaris]
MQFDNKPNIIRNLNQTKSPLLELCLKLNTYLSEYLIILDLIKIKIINLQIKYINI